MVFCRFFAFVIVFFVGIGFCCFVFVGLVFCFVFFKYGVYKSFCSIWFLKLGDVGCG